jgi:hypothetical protein
MASPSPTSPVKVKSEEEVGKETMAEEAEPGDEAGNAIGGPELSNEMLKIMKGIVDYLTEYRDEK